MEPEPPLRALRSQIGRTPPVLDKALGLSELAPSGAICLQNAMNHGLLKAPWERPMKHGLEPWSDSPPFCVTPVPKSTSINDQRIRLKSFSLAVGCGIRS